MEGKEQRARFWEIKYLFHLSFVVIKIIGGLSLCWRDYKNKNISLVPELSTQGMVEDRKVSS